MRVDVRPRKRNAPRPAVADRWAIPLSWLCHQLQHDRGWPWFDITILGRAGAAQEMAAGYWSAWKGDKGELA